MTTTPADVTAAARALCATLDTIWAAERAFLADVSATLSACTVAAEQAMRDAQAREWRLLDAWWLETVTGPPQRLRID